AWLLRRTGSSATRLRAGWRDACGADRAAGLALTRAWASPGGGDLAGARPFPDGPFPARPHRRAAGGLDQCGRAVRPDKVDERRLTGLDRGGRRSVGARLLGEGPGPS